MVRTYHYCNIEGVSVDVSIEISHSGCINGNVYVYVEGNRGEELKCEVTSGILSHYSGFSSNKVDLLVDFIKRNKDLIIMCAKEKKSLGELLE